MKIIKPSVEILRPHMTKDAVNAIYRNIELAGRTCYKSKNKEVEKIENEIITVSKSDFLSKDDKEAEIYRLNSLLQDEQNKSARQFVKGLVKRGHEAMIEHACMTVKFIVDRGVSHELVRHRIASFAQESSRYCNYTQEKFGNEITFIDSVFYKDIPDDRKLAIQHMFTKEFMRPNQIINTLSNVEKRYADWFYSCYVAEESYLEMIQFGATPEEARGVLPTDVKTEVVVTMNMREMRHFLNLRAAGTTGKPHPKMVEVALPLLRQCQELMPELFGDIEVVE